MSVPKPGVETPGYCPRVPDGTTAAGACKGSLEAAFGQQANGSITPLVRRGIPAKDVPQGHRDNRQAVHCL